MRYVETDAALSKPLNVVSLENPLHDDVIICMIISDTWESPNSLLISDAHTLLVVK